MPEKSSNLDWISIGKRDIKTQLETGHRKGNVEEDRINPFYTHTHTHSLVRCLFYGCYLLPDLTAPIVYKC